MKNIFNLLILSGLLIVFSTRHSLAADLEQRVQALEASVAALEKSEPTVLSTCFKHTRYNQNLLTHGTSPGECISGMDYPYFENRTLLVRGRQVVQTINQTEYFCKMTDKEIQDAVNLFIKLNSSFNCP